MRVVFQPKVRKLPLAKNICVHKQPNTAVRKPDGMAFHFTIMVTNIEFNSQSVATSSLQSARQVRVVIV
jgi:hypothetical protein